MREVQSVVIVCHLTAKNLKWIASQNCYLIDYFKYRNVTATHTLHGDLTGGNMTQNNVYRIHTVNKLTLQTPALLLVGLHELTFNFNLGSFLYE